jgi:hypothetical protein
MRPLLAVLLFIFSTSPSSAERTVFFLNGVWNDSVARNANLRILKEEFRTQVSGDDNVDPDTITFKILVNSTEGRAADLWETGLLLSGKRDQLHPWYQMYRKGYISEEAYLHYKEYFDDEAGATLTSLELSEMVRQISLAQEIGPVVVVAHSEGSVFADIAYRHLPVTTGITWVFVGTPLRSTTAPATVVAHDCDKVSAFWSGTKISTEPNSADCHKFSRYVLGSLSYEAKQNIFTAINSGLGTTQETPAISMISLYRQYRASDSHGLIQEITGRFLCEDGQGIGWMDEDSQGVVVHGPSVGQTNIEIATTFCDATLRKQVATVDLDGFPSVRTSPDDEPIRHGRCFEPHDVSLPRYLRIWDGSNGRTLCLGADSTTAPIPGIRRVAIEQRTPEESWERIATSTCHGEVTGWIDSSRALRLVASGVALDLWPDISAVISPCSNVSLEHTPNKENPNAVAVCQPVPLSEKLNVLFKSSVLGGGVPLCSFALDATPIVDNVTFYQADHTGGPLEFAGFVDCQTPAGVSETVGPIAQGRPLEIHIEGKNLGAARDLAAWIHDCDAMTVTHPPTAAEPYGIATCTPRFTSGIKEGLIKDRPGEDGRELCTFRIEVVDQPIVPCSTWEQVLSTSYGVQALAASPTGYVGFTRYGLLRSIEGDSWTTVPFPGQVHKVIWTGNNFLALGNGMEIWRSDDGVDWHSESLPQVGTLFKYPGGMASNGTTDVVTGSLGGYLWSWPYIWVKQPGENWTLVYRGGVDSRFRDVASNRGSFVVTTDYTSIYRGGYENGGLEWEWVAASQPVREVVSTGSEYVAFGNRMERSTDGRSWVGSDFLVGSAPSAIEWTDDRFIGTRYQAVSESFDGLSWTDSMVTDTGGRIRAVADGPGGVVAGGDYGVWKRRSCN